MTLYSLGLLELIVSILFYCLKNRAHCYSDARSLLSPSGAGPLTQLQNLSCQMTDLMTVYLELIHNRSFWLKRLYGPEKKKVYILICLWIWNIWRLSHSLVEPGTERSWRELLSSALRSEHGWSSRQTPQLTPVSCSFFPRCSFF